MTEQPSRVVVSSRELLILLAALSDSTTFIEDELESLGIQFWNDSITAHEEVASRVGVLASRLARLSLTPSASLVLSSVGFADVAGGFHRILDGILDFSAKPEEVYGKGPQQLTLFDHQEMVQLLIAA